ncbi:unnamed protein product [Cunninghamella blakesleeana]
MAGIISTKRKYFSILYFLTCLILIAFFLTNWHAQHELKKRIICPTTVNKNLSMHGQQIIIEGKSCVISTIIDDSKTYRTTPSATSKPSELLEEDPFTSLESSAPPQIPFTIVTAASANHLCALENLLYSLNDLRTQLIPFPKIIVYNLGVNKTTQLPILQQLHKNGLMDELETFQYKDYPSFWDISYQAGEYGWKTGIVHEASKKYGGFLLWLDAGNQVTADFLYRFPSYLIKHQGFWSPRSAFTIGRWTHPGMLDYFHKKNEDDDINDEQFLNQLNCNGAVIGFDAGNKTIMDTIISPWYKCGLDKNCIAPPGSSRSNHRQDQAAITYLAYKTNHACHRSPRSYKIFTHRDIVCRTNLLERDLQLLYHPSTIDYPSWTPTDTFDLIHHPEWRHPVPKVLMR